MNFTKSNREKVEITNNRERRATLAELHKGYNSFPNPLLKTSRLSSTDKEVYMHIVYLANVDTDKEHRLHGRCCRMSLSKISSQAHVSYPTLLKSLRRLEKYNVIAIDDDIKPWIICTRSILDWAI